MRSIRSVSPPAPRTPWSPPRHGWGGDGSRGVKILGVEQDLKDLHDKQLTFQVLIIEVYLTHTLADPRQVAAVAPPWSSLPWQLIVLMEEAVKRRLGALSQEEARRKGVPWLDLVRDQKAKDGLAALVEEFRRQGYVPAALRGFVTPAEARSLG